jgi:hypothetical protein
MSDQVRDSQKDPVQRLIPGYSDEPRPLGGYLTLAGAFNAVFAGFLLLLKLRNQSLPTRVGVADVLLLGVATHKVSRLLAKDWVTSPLRAPFTEYEGPTGIPAELSEKPRGEGLRYAVGELVT